MNRGHETSNSNRHPSAIALSTLWILQEEIGPQRKRFVSTEHV